MRIPSTATDVEWDLASHFRNYNPERYDVVTELLAAGIDAANIRVYFDDDAWGTYWVVDLEGGRNVVMTDCTEDYLIWMEGPWPWVGTFSNRDGVRTEVNHDLDDLVAGIVTWCTA